MKKLLLIAFLFLITPDAKADMDNICKIPPVGKWIDIGLYIEMYNCERNNILFVNAENFQRDNLQKAISHFCRFDRNVVETKIGFSCVLYDKKPRTVLERVN